MPLQSRVGGRVRSVPFAGGTAELGAQFVWGAGSDIDGGTRRQGNPVTEVSDMCWSEGLPCNT